MNANRTIIAVTNTGPNSPNTALIEACTYCAPAASAVIGTPDIRHMKAVAEQISIVSMYTDSI